MSEWKRTSGDVGDTIEVEAVGISPSLESVTNVEARVSKDGEDTVALTGAVTDADGCIFTVYLSPWLETAAPGVWFIETTLTFDGGNTRTIPPEDNQDWIKVNARSVVA